MDTLPFLPWFLVGMTFIFLAAFTFAVVLLIVFSHVTGTPEQRQRQDADTIPITEIPAIGLAAKSTIDHAAAEYLQKIAQQTSHSSDGGSQ